MQMLDHGFILILPCCTFMQYRLLVSIQLLCRVDQAIQNMHF